MNKANRKVYDPSDIEKRWIREWESRSLYSMSKDNDIDDKTFSIQLPPLTSQVLFTWATHLTRPLWIF